jgi:hypothetical protein
MEDQKLHFNRCKTPEMIKVIMADTKIIMAVFICGMLNILFNLHLFFIWLPLGADIVSENANKDRN